MRLEIEIRVVFLWPCFYGLYSSAHYDACDGLVDVSIFGI